MRRVNGGEYPDPPDLAEVLEYYGIRAHRKMTLCPFHEDSVPSLSCNFDKCVYKCHACGEAGNSWTLIMRKEGLDFGGAKRFAATHDFTEKESRGSREQIRGSTYGGRRKVPTRPTRNDKGKRPYVPSWRR